MCAWLQCNQSLGKKGAGTEGSMKETLLDLSVWQPLCGQDTKPRSLGRCTEYSVGKFTGDPSDPIAAPRRMEKGAALLAVTQSYNPNLIVL